MAWLCIWMIALSNAEREQGSDRLDETGRLERQLLGPRCHPCPVRRRLPPLTTNPVLTQVGPMGPAASCGIGTSSSGSAMPGLCRGCFL